MKHAMETHTKKKMNKNGLFQILAIMDEELALAHRRHINGASTLYGLLHAPWLQALFKVYESLHQYVRSQPDPITLQASAIYQEVRESLTGIPQSDDTTELRQLLRNPHIKALLSCHDTIAQKNFDPVLPPLPDNIPDNEEAMRIVCLVKNKQPLGATIKRHELTGDIVVARVIHGGLADRSGLLYAGDKLVEVNGISVDGLEPEQVIQILAQSLGTIMFKLIPVSSRLSRCQMTLYVRAMSDYCPEQDSTIPCSDAGLAFRKGEILQIVDQNDTLWWQAQKLSDLMACAGLIPSNYLLKRKQRECWWSQPFHPHTCMKGTALSTVDEEEDTPFDEKWVETDEEAFESDELKEDEEEFSASTQGYIAGFRRSMRLCRRKAQNSQVYCYARCPNICYSPLASHYEEVVRYQRHPNDQHRLIVLVGPSGVGVNELRRRLIGIDPNHYQGAVPHSTRARKSYEEDGREYHFINKDTFQHMVYNHRFLEYGEYKGELYGTSIDAVRSVLEEGQICIIDLEPQAIHGARTHELKPFVIFIKPASLSNMMQSRKDSKITTEYYVNRHFKDEDFQEMEEMAKRIESQYGQFFDQVIVNDILQDACVELLTAVHRAQDEPQWVPAAWLCPSSPL